MSIGISLSCKGQTKYIESKLEHTLENVAW
jgi:hypothetical protein